ncbi:TRAP transporter small permease [Acidimangrovimonas pyrenivorans]|uniref:TRAP transporter small permease protein n=1 Tax=Acidimangrovimonas pyrenivorans TaxID=2030798 RepID=A0ABV7AIZ4_9RHOB
MTASNAPLGAVSRLLDAVCWICTLLTGTFMVTLIAIFGWLVWGRYVMNDTPTWVEQVALMLVVWITFLGAALGVRRSHHLSVDFLREAFPRPLRLLCTALALLAMIFFGAIMAWQGAALTAANMDRAVPMLGIAEGWRAMPVSISGALIALFSVEHLAALLAGRDKEL